MLDTILAIINNGAIGDLSLEEAKKSIAGWMQDIMDYRKNINKELINYAEIFKQITFLEKKETTIKNSDFPITLLIPIIKNKQIITNPTIINGRTELTQKIRNIKSQYKFERPHRLSLISLTLKSSPLHRLLTNQAYDYRKLQFVIEALNDIVIENLNPYQQTLKEEIRTVLKNPLYLPHNNIMKKVHFKELRAELWASLNFWRSRSNYLNSRYSLRYRGLQRISNITPGNLLEKYIVIGIISPFLLL